ncbi:MAG: hypothetical protein COA79_26685 [Planctomycetota bacterium]|nr:MAG: hypothetical protein COA79_26685 [Planctomycetota bacterium]
MKRKKILAIIIILALSVGTLVIFYPEAKSERQLGFELKEKLELGQYSIGEHDNALLNDFPSINVNKLNEYTHYHFTLLFGYEHLTLISKYNHFIYAHYSTCIGSKTFYENKSELANFYTTYKKSLESSTIESTH